MLRPADVLSHCSLIMARVQNSDRVKNRDCQNSDHIRPTLTVIAAWLYSRRRPYEFTIWSQSHSLSGCHFY